MYNGVHFLNYPDLFRTSGSLYSQFLSDPKVPSGIISIFIYQQTPLILISSGNVTLSNGTYFYKSPVIFTPEYNYSLAISYSGDTNFGNQSMVIPGGNDFSVGQGSTMITIKSPGNIYSSNFTTYKIMGTVTALTYTVGGYILPQGFVNIQCRQGDTEILNTTVSFRNGAFSYDIKNLIFGRYSVFVTYLGNNYYLNSSTIGPRWFTFYVVQASPSNRKLALGLGLGLGLGVPLLILVVIVMYYRSKKQEVVKEITPLQNDITPKDFSSTSTY